MPCICDGAISGNEFLKSTDKKRIDDINEKLREVSHLIKKLDEERPEDCYQQHHYEQWFEAFFHHLYGCPENRDGL